MCVFFSPSTSAPSTAGQYTISWGCSRYIQRKILFAQNNTHQTHRFWEEYYHSCRVPFSQIDAYIEGSSSVTRAAEVATKGLVKITCDEKKKR